MVAIIKGIHLLNFAGIAPIPWTVNAEIYPLWARSVCTSVATATNWLKFKIKDHIIMTVFRSFNLIIAITFLSLTNLLTRAGAFLLYCGLGALGWIIFWLFLPETSGKSLEEMETLFSGRLLVPCDKKK